MGDFGEPGGPSERMRARRMEKGLGGDSDFDMDLPHASLTDQDPDRVYFDHSQMSQEERAHVSRLQEILESDFDHAFAVGMVIIRVVELGEKPPYEGWFGDITPSQREELVGYIEQRKQQGAYDDL